MFRKKVKVEDLSPQLSVLDKLDPEVRAKIEQDVVDICKLIKAWPSLLTDGEKAQIPGELRGIFTKVGGKLATAMVTGKDLEEAFPEILKVVAIPNFIKSLIAAVYTNLG
jgi:hypothetical protein